MIREKGMAGKAVWMISQLAGSKQHGMRFRDYYLAKEFLKKGYTPYIIAASCSHLRSIQPRVHDTFTFEVIDGIHYIWVRVPDYQKSRSVGRALAMGVFALRLFTLNTQKLMEPAAIVLNSLAPFPSVIARRWARKFRCKLIFEVVDIWPLTIVEIGNISQRHPFVVAMQFFADYAYRNSDFVVSVLPCSQQYMVDHGMQKENFVYIPNGTDGEILADGEPLSDEIVQKIPHEKFLVGYTGKLGVSNALDSLLKAAALLKERTEIHILIVGDGVEKQRLEQEARDLALRNVTFIDYINKNMIQPLLQLLDVCYIGVVKKPLFMLGVSPTKIFDYMLSGKPILQAITAGNDIVGDADCGLSVEAENPEAIARGILSLHAMDPGERKRLGDNAKSYVLRHHTYDKLVEKYIALFDASHKQ